MIFDVYMHDACKTMQHAPSVMIAQILADCMVVHGNNQPGFEPNFALPPTINPNLQLARKFLILRQFPSQFALKDTIRQLLPFRPQK
jgi:hypothetical protein